MKIIVMAVKARTKFLHCKLNNVTVKVLVLPYKGKQPSKHFSHNNFSVLNYNFLADKFSGQVQLVLRLYWRNIVISFIVGRLLINIVHL